MPIHPMPDYVLVELRGKFKNVTAPTKSYEGATTGIVKEAAEEVDFLIGKRVFWEEQITGTQVERDGKAYAFVDIDDIRGYENGE